MADAPVPYGRKTRPVLAFKEIHILWITAGLSCDGDTISMTAATQPSLEDLLMGGVPGIPKVHLHNPVLAYEVGNERIKAEGYWAALGNDRRTGQPITTCEWLFFRVLRVFRSDPLLVPEECEPKRQARIWSRAGSETGRNDHGPSDRALREEDPEAPRRS